MDSCKKECSAGFRFINRCGMIYEVRPNPSVTSSNAKDALSVLTFSFQRSQKSIYLHISEVLVYRSI